MNNFTKDVSSLRFFKVFCTGLIRSRFFKIETGIFLRHDRCISQIHMIFIGGIAAITSNTRILVLGFSANTDSIQSLDVRMLIDSWKWHGWVCILKFLGRHYLKAWKIWKGKIKVDLTIRNFSFQRFILLIFFLSYVSVQNYIH